MAGFDIDSEGKKEESLSQVKLGDKAASKTSSFEDLSLQELIGSLETNPSILKQLSAEKQARIAETIGNQRIWAILNGGRPVLHRPSFDIYDADNREIRVNVIKGQGRRSCLR